MSRGNDGIVWWDKIRCVMSPDCTEFMKGKSVQDCISPTLLKRLDDIQFDSAGGPEAKREREQREREAEATSRAAADRAAEEMVAETTKPCPNCAAPTEYVDGCKHMTCVCKHEYCRICRREWVRGHLNVRCTPS